MARLFDAPEGDIGISIYVKNVVDEGESAKWKYLYNTSIDNDLKVDEVLSNRYSTLNVVIDSVGMIYFKEKQNAYKEHKYVKTSGEEKDGLKGNIYCQNISIVDRNGEVLLPLIFCVATYKTRVCSDKDYFAVEKVKNLLSKVGLDIKYEVMHLLLYEHMGIRRKLIGG